MTKEDAIWTLQYVDPEDPAFHEAVGLAVNALRTQLEAENGAPLTLDELRKMDGEPVWIEYIHKRAHSKYRIVRWVSDNTIVFEEYDKEFGPYNSAYLGHYGKNWLAYRHKSMEGTT